MEVYLKSIEYLLAHKYIEGDIEGILISADKADSREVIPPLMSDTWPVFEMVTVVEDYGNRYTVIFPNGGSWTVLKEWTYI